MTDAIPLWLPVVGFDGYEVSHRGQVRSIDRTVHYKDGRRSYFRPGRPLLPSPGGRGGHLFVNLYRDGKAHPRYVHHLVLEAFDRPRPPGMECRHGPGGHHDNRWPENICWGTKADNMGPDKVRDGTSNAKLMTVEIVRDCRRRHADGQDYRVLAREYGVKPGTMRDAIFGRTWAHVR